MKYKVFSLIRYAQFIGGTWPYEFENETRKKVYNIYSYFVQVLFTTFALLMIAGTPQAILSRSPRINDHFALTLLYMKVVVTLYILKWNRTKRVVKRILRDEDMFLQKAEQGLIELYKENIMRARRICKPITIWMYMTGAAYGTKNYLELVWNYDSNDTFLNRNTTIGRRLLPEEAFMPFNTDNYYIYAYMIQMVAAFYLATIKCSDALLMTLVIYCIGRLQILQNMAKNYDSIPGEGEQYEKRVYGRVKNCIIEHKNVIRLIEELDSVLKMYMLLDFTTLSLHLSTILFELLNSSVNVSKAIYQIGFFISTGFQFLFYWHSNEIREVSKDVGLAVYESNWFNQTLQVKRALIIIMIRSTRPLTLHVSAMYELSNEILLRLLKAFFSYLTVIRRLTSQE